MKQLNRVLFYSKDFGGLGAMPEEVVGGYVLPEGLEVFGNVSDLTTRLCMPRCESTIAVLHVSDAEDMKHMLSIRPLLGSTPVLLILPDRSMETVTAGHSLYPKYLSFKDEPLDGLKAVLGRRVETGGKDVNNQGRNCP